MKLYLLSVIQPDGEPPPAELLHAIALTENAAERAHLHQARQSLC
jgi:hypothetical protein